jgi:hypothetical protein
VGLACPNQNASTHPVDIVNPQPDYFAGANAETGQEKHHCLLSQTTFGL